MTTRWHVSLAAILYVVVAAGVGQSADPSAVPLPTGVRAVWDLSKAYRETTPTQERVSPIRVPVRNELCRPLYPSITNCSSSGNSRSAGMSAPPSATASARSSSSPHRWRM